MKARRLLLIDPWVATVSRPPGTSLNVDPSNTMTCNDMSYVCIHDLVAHAAPSMRLGFTTICVHTDLHATLAALKLHPRQPYHEVSTALRKVENARERRR